MVRMKSGRVAPLVPEARFAKEHAAFALRPSEERRAGGEDPPQQGVSRQRSTGGRTPFPLWRRRRPGTRSHSRWKPSGRSSRSRSSSWARRWCRRVTAKKRGDVRSTTRGTSGLFRRRLWCRSAEPIRAAAVDGVSTDTGPTAICRRRAARGRRISPSSPAREARTSTLPGSRPQSTRGLRSA